MCADLHKYRPVAANEGGQWEVSCRLLGRGGFSVGSP